MRRDIGERSMCDTQQGRINIMNSIHCTTNPDKLYV